MEQEFFNTHLAQTDKDVFAAIEREYTRQRDQIELIASENIASQAVLDAQGSVLTNKYAEGYPGKRYYGGCAFVDEVEELARERLKKLFGAEFANVQPHSGSQANQAVFYSVLKPGDKILGMALDQGGHLTHGAKVNVSGKLYEAAFYGIDKHTEQLDYDHIAQVAEQEQPKLIIAGASAYSRKIDFARFARIAQDVGAYLLVDMAHIAGLVAAGLHQNPLTYADFVTSTTHKTLRGPRGGIVMTNNPKLAKKINSLVFPGLQGGPLMHVIAAKAVAFGEALQPAFKTYQKQVTQNAQTLAEELSGNNIRVVSGGTDNHLLMADLRSRGLAGKVAEDALEACGITCNKNAVPDDPQPPQITSGLRFGTPATTTRGFSEPEFKQIGTWVAQALDALENHPEGDEALFADIKAQVKELCAKFPIYQRV